MISKKKGSIIPSYKNELRIMRSQTELLTLKLYFFNFLS